MALLLSSHISFTEEEYESIFREFMETGYGLRAILDKKGVISLKESCGRLTSDVIENFVFNSITRKTPLFPLFSVYKRLAQTLSYDQVWFYTRSRRLDIYGGGMIKSKKVERDYISGVVKIIFSDAQESDIVCYDVNKYDDTKNINAWNDIVTETLAPTKTVELCSCPFKMYWTITCCCCIKKMVSFADDCIINLGEVIFVREIYKFLLFFEGFEFVVDIKYVIGLKFLKIM